MAHPIVPSSGSIKIDVDHRGETAIVRPSGHIDVHSSPDVRDSLQVILSTEPLPRTVIVDLASVPYIETSGIATLIEALRIARRLQIGFCLRGLDGSVLRLFEVTGVLTMFDHDSREERVP